MAQAERLADQLGDVGVGHVVNPYVAHALLAQLGGQGLGGGLRVAVHGGVGNHDALFLGLVLAPLVVLVDEVHQILPPHGAVEGADELDLVQNAPGLFQEHLHLGAVLAHDVGQVAAGVVNPIPVKVHLVGKELAVQGPEGAEGVGGKEGAVGGVEGHHSLRPMDHGGLHEGDRVLAEGVGIALPDLNELVAVHMKTELPHEHEGLGGGDNLSLGPADENLLDGRAVVGLHVVDQQVIQRPAL